MNRMGLYLRISDDQDGTSTATERQRADCERYAAYRGWEIVDVFEDRDLSAFKPKVRREQFERMIKAVEAGDINGVLAYRIDRLARRLIDFVRLHDACEKAGAAIITTGDGIDTTTDGGRFVAPILVQIGNQESRNQSTRLRRKAKENAENGVPYRGGTRMFGFTTDRSSIVADEAELIHEAAERIRAGEGLRGVCNDWKTRRVTTPTGRAWRQHTLKQMLTSAALSGQREHDGRFYPGQWPAILTSDETLRLRAILTDPGRRKNVTARRYLLTGMLTCGRCGQALTARPRKDGVRRYICAKQPENANCGRIARLAEPVEQLVRDAVIIALDGVDLRAFMEQPTEDEGLPGRIREDEERLELLALDFAELRITRAEWLAARDLVQARLEAARTRLAKTNGTSAIARWVGAGDAVRAAWEAQTLDWRRAVIGALVDRVVIHAAVKGSNVFNPALVEIVWRF